MNRSIIAVLALLVCLSLMTAQADVESTSKWPAVRSGRVLVQAESLSLADFDNIAGIAILKVSRPFADWQPDQFLVEFDPVVSVETASELIRSLPGIKAVEPCVLKPWSELQLNPNDLLLPSQWHIDAIKGPAAWAVFQGSDTVQVGIIDGGVNFVHPDLAPNIWINPGEDLNGNRIIEPSEEDSVDNDSNGYIDDFWGWDWIDLDSSAVWPGEDPGPPDNDPSDFDGHGTHCAGDACAASNNLEGVASPGFHTQIMALRAGYMSASGQGYVDLLAAVQAVYYAIANGAEVLSMSFGGTGVVPFFQSALQTANDNGLVLVAAAGNDGSSMIQYPAGYDVVNAVAATAEGDILADFTNYGSWITYCSPGEGIFSTVIDGYGNMSGTSMAAPVAAGTAALVKALMPEWNSQDVGIWLAYTADNIDAQNPGYVGQMGGGRINAQQAVDLFVSIDSLWVDSGSGGNRLQFSQEGSLFVQYHKFYGSTTNTTLTLTSPNPRVSFSQDTYNIGVLLEGESGDNSADPFLVTVTHGGTDYEEVEIHANFTDPGFDFTQILYVSVGSGQVLIIDADQNNDERTASYYETNIAQMGYTSETWDREEMTSLGENLASYDLILHFSGTAETGIFPGDDWDLLEGYLASGGKLIVTGQNVAEDLSSTQPDILQDVLHVAYSEPHSGILTVRGVETNPLTNGMYMVMAGSGGAWNQNSMDVVTALPGADPFFLYRLDEPDNLAGVRVQEGSGDLFYCGFGIEGINDSTSSGNTQVEVLQMMFDAIGITGETNSEPLPMVDKVTLHGAYPNPFNSQVSISYELPAASSVAFTIFNLQGQAIHHVSFDRIGQGSHRWQWQAPSITASGLYFMQLETPETTLTTKLLYIK
ncbi:S8 family serine peptidase [bacterium]|nr:S8 family serine peptidase [bacterium]MBU1652557.1 S8 family serine peptidase [bacterium]